MPKKTFAEDVYSGETVDQVVAKKIGQETALPSLELATEDFTGYIGGCDTQYACAYMNTISWSSATTPVPMEINPRVVFERLFGRPGTVDQRKRRMQRDKSILDSLTDDVSDLKRDLGGKDATRLSEYLDHVREVERRIQVAEKRSESSVTADAPVGIPEQWEEHARLQYELMLLAYASDATRVITFMKAKDASMLSYLNLGIAEPHHGMTHNLQVEGNAANLVKINTFHVSLFAEFLERMKKTPDGDGSLLDHTMLLYGSGMSDAPDALAAEPSDGPGRRLDVWPEGQPPRGGAEGHAVCQHAVDDCEQVRLQSQVLRHVEQGRSRYRVARMHSWVGGVVDSAPPRCGRVDCRAVRG